MQSRELARIKYEWVDLDDGLLSGQKCKNSIRVPFIRGSEPQKIPFERKKCRVKEKKQTISIIEQIREIFKDF